MTPEQNEKWREAVFSIQGRNGEIWDATLATAALLPRDRFPNQSDEFIRKKIREREQHLTGWGEHYRTPDGYATRHYEDNWGVPCWAAACWAHSADQGWVEEQPWSRAFTLRGQAALIGLQILFPLKAQGKPVYGRLALRWLHEVYRPLAEWVRAGKRARRGQYYGLLELQQLCGNWKAPDHKKWSGLAQKMKTESQNRPGGREGESSAHDLILKHIDFYAVREGVDLASCVLFGSTDSWWRAHWGSNLSLGIAALYSRSGMLTVHTDLNTTRLMADAFLTALEAECPPPDWLELE